MDDVRRSSNAGDGEPLGEETLIARTRSRDARLNRASPDDFLADPIGKWTTLGKAIAWCASPALGGAITWGRATEAEARASLRLLEAYRHQAVARQVTLITDARNVQGVDPAALEPMLDWVRERRNELRHRVGMQLVVVPRGLLGVMLAGILPMCGEGHPFRVTTNLHEGLREVVDDGGDALADELDAILHMECGVSPHLRRVRELLKAQSGAVDLSDAARKLGVSRRSLQRALCEAGVSYREEQHEARFAAARAMLESSDLKMSAIAARLGITERGLTRLFRARGEASPIESRRRARTAAAGAAG